VLGVDRVQPDFYRPLPAEATHAEIAAHEMALLGPIMRRSAAGFCGNGSFPKISARPSKPVTIREGRRFRCDPRRCVALGSECVEMLLAHPRSLDLQPLAAHAQAWLGIDGEALTQAISNLVAEIPEIERLFDTSILEIEVANAILDQAREILTIRNLQAIDQMSSLRETAERLEARTTALEDKQRRDR